MGNPYNLDQPHRVPVESNRLHALLVSPISPWDPPSGGQQRTALLYESLKRTMPVDVLLLGEGDANRAEAGVRKEIVANLSWKQGRFALRKYAIHSWANAWCHANIDWSRYGLVVGRYVTPITKVAWPRRLKTIVDCDDAYYQYCPDSASVLDRLRAFAFGRLRFWQTRGAVRRYDHAFFCSRKDQRQFPCKESTVLPNVVRLPTELAGQANEAADTLLIVGAMWYPPNRQGVDWFLRHCWPAIAARCPEIHLRIIGPAASEVRRGWEAAVRTQAPGFVEDLGTEYARALLAVAPIHYGGGTCIKFLEAGSYRKPCVVTSHVFRGFDTDFENDVSTVVAADPASMVDSCVRLVKDAGLRDRIAGAAYDRVARSYTAEKFSEVATAVVREMMRRSKA